MATQLTAILSKLSSYTGTFLNSAIVLVTIAAQQLTTSSVFYCPCVIPNVKNTCKDTGIGNATCTNLLNFSYGSAFIAAPAIGLFFFGFATSTRLWKTLTGCCNKAPSQKRDANQICCTLTDVVSRALIAPSAWVAVAFLDGKYFACAFTEFPYELGPAPAPYLNCEAVVRTKTITYSYIFNENRSFSQLVGWVIISVLVFSGILAYGILKCTSPLTYYQSKFYTFYRTAEKKEFSEEMKAKALSDAKANVKLFMEKPRSKMLWDEVSTVYEFHRDKKNVALYSNLHKWVLGEKDKNIAESKPLLGSHDETIKPGESSLSV